MEPESRQHSTGRAQGADVQDVQLHGNGVPTLQQTKPSATQTAAAAGAAAGTNTVPAAGAAPKLLLLLLPLLVPPSDNRG